VVGEGRGLGDRQRYWDHVYETDPERQRSWHRAHLEPSLRLIKHATEDLANPIIDVGGGSSTLVDDLLDRGYSSITVLDVSAAALGAARERLGPSRADRVRWICADVTTAPLQRDAYVVWHDRGAFHFLIAADDRARYVSQIKRAVRPGGHVILATYTLEGPSTSSGLPVMRYSPDSLGAELGAGFQRLEVEEDPHITPAAAIQPFIYCHWVKQS
jgi:SAM-dependent methyltransferase